tara:strand:+ start:289 stop:507 length:219 start_codon:yes stop_codon:yes gene_type:complete
MKMTKKEIKRMRLDPRSVIFDLDTTPIKSSGTDRIRQMRLAAMYLGSCVAFIVASVFLVFIIWGYAVILLSQ